MRTPLLKAIAIVTVLLALMVSVPFPAPKKAGGIASTTIAIDGNMTDWTPVFMDPANSMNDRAGSDDPDDPGTQSRDLSLVAYTWDADHLYFYFRRTTQGTNSLTYNVYIDRDGDGLLENTDMVVRYTVNGTSYQGATLNYYTPNVAGGDAMGGDGWTPPGTTGANVNGGNMTGTSAANGIEMECRLAWNGLSLPSGSPVGLHFATGRNAGLPSAIEDNVSDMTMRYRAVTLTPDNDGGAKPGTSLTYTHSITNGGNARETFDLTAVSSQGWTTTVLANGVQVTSVTLDPKQTATLTVRLDIPASAPSSTRDVTNVTAVCRSAPAVSATAKEETMVGLITLSPYRQGGMAQQGSMHFVHTLSNNTTQTAVVSLTGVSKNSWPVSIENESGAPIGLVSLPARTSMTIIASITVPAGTPIGTNELTTLFATLQSDPSVQGLAYDTIDVRKEVDVEPDNAGPAGPNTVISYSHTVTNSWNTTRTITLNATSSRGWPVTLWDSDGVTPISSVTLAPFGASRQFYARVSVPAGAVAGTVDTVTVRASYGAVADSAADVTTVSRLALYATPGYVVPSSSYNPSESVYARAMGISSGSSVRFRWTDANGSVVYTSPLIGVDVSQMAGSSYSLPATATAGTWTCNLLDNAGATLATQTFTVQPLGYLTLSIDVTSLDFGHVDPGVPVPPRTVGVTVSSSNPFTLSRTISGDTGLMGLAVSGPANGLKPKGGGVYFDSYQVTPSWSADPSVPLHTSVLYTATQ